ncbi:hypothetical protein ACFQZ4_43940 [Catellatospora coxensis]
MDDSSTARHSRCAPTPPSPSGSAQATGRGVPTANTGQRGARSIRESVSRGHTAPGAAPRVTPVVTTSWTGP